MEEMYYFVTWPRLRREWVMDLEQRSGIGLHTSIVSALRKYRSVTLEFLATVLERSPGELEEYIARLEREKVVHREGDTITLAPAGPARKR